MANCCNICTGITVIPVKPEHLFPSNRQSMAALPDFLSRQLNWIYIPSVTLPDDRCEGIRRASVEYPYGWRLLHGETATT